MHKKAGEVLHQKTNKTKALFTFAIQINSVKSLSKLRGKKNKSYSLDNRRCRRLMHHPIRAVNIKEISAKDIYDCHGSVATITAITLLYTSEPFTVPFT